MPSDSESSVCYLWAPVARRIAAAIPDCKLIAILRHPVDQARSWAEVQLGHPPTTGELATLLACEDGIDGAIPLNRHGQYHRDLQAYFTHFPARQIFVRTFEDLTARQVPCSSIFSGGSGSSGTPWTCRT